MALPEKYSRAQITLHWVILLLLIVSYVSSESISHAYHDFVRNGVAEVSLAVRAHVIVGIVIGVLAVLRIWLRVSRPAPEELGEGIQLLVAKLVKLGLYIAMVLLPVTGALTWFGGVGATAEVHEIIFNLGMAALILHVAAALLHQFVIKDNLMARMR